MRKLSARLCASVALAMTCQVQAQTGSVPPSTSQSQSRETLIINGKRMPTAEAPRSATCEALVRQDPYFKALIETSSGAGLLPPFIYLPTRMPRSADYRAAPLTPIGSPLPEFGRSRFGVGGRDSATQGNSAGQTNAADNIPEASNQVASGGTAQEETGWEFSDRRAVDACRGAYVAGGAGSLPGDEAGAAARGNPGYGGLGGTISKLARGRAEIARYDKTLPTAFYLFDQNRFGESLHWFKKAAVKLPHGDGGDEATLFVGKLYLMGAGPWSNPAEGVKWLKRTALGRFNIMYETPVFDPKQPEMNTAMGEAAVILGNVYRTGFKGVRKDLNQSRKWYERAVDVGHVAAGKTLGDIYYEGLGIPRDVKRAASYYRKAAKLGLPTAQFALAEILHSGDGDVNRDVKEALLWYQAAGKLEHPGALYALAQAYDLGEGVKSDQQTALGFYRAAALKGHSGAIAAMGTYFYEGRLLPKDPAMARKWFEQSANAADPDGTFNLAAMMARGEGGPRDVVQAWALMKRASTLGNETAPTALAALETKMTLAEKQAANAMAGRR